ncbi:ABA_G0048110.mRNA.1.CDS.1 [Saccharomyces cerevisiae]|nr:ABA_G0048110.mRNA.1.CDS.1 [Saccharomyces cerevisiae]CAI6874344.1 ABA_G0048110.mRNA.1.CDS.1 [Saccharomyces cerevisiae]
MAKMMLLMISGLFIGFTFFHVGVNAIGLQNSLFACFMAIVISAPATNQIQERATVAKELYEVRFILSFLLSFCGAVQPASLMPGFWTFMWKLSPYTYFLQNLVGLLMHDKPVRCSKKELSLFQPPVGQTCGEFTEPFF